MSHEKSGGRPEPSRPAAGAAGSDVPPPSNRATWFFQIVGLIGVVISVIGLILTVLGGSGGSSQNISVVAEDSSGVVTSTANVSQEGGDNSHMESHTYQSGGGPIYVNPDSSEVPSASAPLTSNQRLLADSYDLVRNRDEDAADKIHAMAEEILQAENVDWMTFYALCYNEGLALHQQGDDGAAISCFTEAIKGGVPDAYYCKGVIFAKEGTQKAYEDAIDTFSLAIAETRKPEYYRARAWAYQQMGKSDLAEQDWETAEQLSAGNPSDTFS